MTLNRVYFVTSVLRKHLLVHSLPLIIFRPLNLISESHLKNMQVKSNGEVPNMTPHVES